VTATAYSADTTITITGGSDYSLANATISGQAYSYAAAPQGFPQWFNYTPVWTCVSGAQPVLGNGTLTGRFRINGAALLYLLRLVWGSTTTGGDGGIWDFSIPVNIASTGFQYLGQTHIRRTGIDNNSRFVQASASVSASSIRNFISLDAGSNLIKLTYDSPFTWADGNSLEFQIEYEL
jgi:hypothetical protein